MDLEVELDKQKRKNLGAGMRKAVKFSKYAGKTTMQKNLGREKGMCVRQWEPSAQSHFTGNKRSREKKVSQQDSDTMFSGDFYDKVQDGLQRCKEIRQGKREEAQQGGKGPGALGQQEQEWKGTKF